MLTAVPAGCGSVGCPEPDEEDFSLDAIFGESEVTTILENWGISSRDDITCEIACRFVYDRDRVWMVDSIEKCQHTIAADAGEPGAKAGDVRCEGHGVEYGCE